MSSVGCGTAPMGSFGFADAVAVGALPVVPAPCPDRNQAAIRPMASTTTSSPTISGTADERRGASGSGVAIGLPTR